MMKVDIVILIIIIFVLDNECLIMLVYMLYGFYEDKRISNVDLSSSSFVFISSAAS